MAEFSTHFDDADNPEASRECERLAALMTACFDGEAAAEETRLARQHLLECARCAWSWESWQRTRYLLQSSPVPPVPVGLLVRILLACRLSALPRRKKTGLAVSSQPASFKAHDMEMLGAQRHAAGFAFDLAPAPNAIEPETAVGEAPLRALMPLVPVPPHLKDEILKRTVGRSVELSQLENQATASQMLGATPSRPRQLTKRPRWDFGLASPRRASQFAALAVPATLAWLLLVTPRVPGPQLATSLAQSPPPPPVATSQQGLANPGHRLAKLPMTPPLVPAPALPATASAQANAMPVTVTPVAPTAPTAAVHSPVANSAAAVAVAQPAAHAMLASYARASKPVAPTSNRASEATNVTTAVASSPIRIAARPQPRLVAPRLTLATVPLKWSRSNEAVTGGNTASSGANLRAAVLDLDGQVRQPQSNDGDDNSDTADNISDISDHRPAAARQAIDSYRATLLTDAAIGDTPTATGDTDDSGTNG